MKLVQLKGHWINPTCVLGFFWDEDKDGNTTWSAVVDNRLNHDDFEDLTQEDVDNFVENANS